MISTFKTKKKQRSKVSNSFHEEIPSQNIRSILNNQQITQFNSFSQYCLQKYSKIPEFNGQIIKSGNDLGDQIIIQEVEDWNESDSKYVSKVPIQIPHNKTVLSNNTFLTTQFVSKKKGPILVPIAKKQQTFLFSDIKTNATRIKKQEFTDYVHDVIDDTKQTRLMAEENANKAFGKSEMWHKIELNKKYFEIAHQDQRITDIKQIDEQLDDLKNIYNQKQCPIVSSNFSFHNWKKSNLGQVPSNDRCASTKIRKKGLNSFITNKHMDERDQRFRFKPGTSVPVQNRKNSFQMNLSLDGFIQKRKII